MKITLLGAAGGEVTGSAYLLQTNAGQCPGGLRPLPGARRNSRTSTAFRRRALAQLHAVVLTHAHLDHTGRLPLLTRYRLQGPDLRDERDDGRSPS